MPNDFSAYNERVFSMGIRGSLPGIRFFFLHEATLVLSYISVFESAWLSGKALIFSRMALHITLAPA
jgi:hypothetical protein